jgi:hypothetical protein
MVGGEHDIQVVLEPSMRSALSCWLAKEGGGTVSVDTGYSAPVNLPATIHLLGSEAAISINSDSVVTLHSPGQADEVFDLSPKPGQTGSPAPKLWLSSVEQALKSGMQIAPNFDDGLADAIAMDKLKAAAFKA